MTVSLPLNYDLIQTIRIAQALMEVHVTVAVPLEHAHKFSYLANQGFTVNCSILGTRYAKQLDIEVSHGKPSIRIGSHTGLLLYPRQLFLRSEALWTKRDQDYLFRSYPTAERLKQASEWMQRTGLTPTIHMRNFERLTGTDKLWDDEYYHDIARSKFSIIPNGLDGELDEHKAGDQFKWTYRFLDAVLLGAIPIVQEKSALYEPFEYYLMSNNTYDYDSLIAESNLAKAYELFTMDSNKLRSLI